MKKYWRAEAPISIHLKQKKMPKDELSEPTRMGIILNMDAAVTREVLQNRMPCLMISWNPADPADVGLWTDVLVDRSYLKHLLLTCLEQIK